MTRQNTASADHSNKAMGTANSSTNSPPNSPTRPPTPIKLTNPNVHQYPDKMPTHFNTILLDPAWPVLQRGSLGAQKHYDLMTMDEIKALPVNDLLSDNAHVWLWMTNATLPYLKEIMDSWGLKYRSIFTWCKPRLGLGQYLRNSTEQLILATKGKAPILFKGQMNWGFMAVQDHSHKPECIAEIIERCSPGPYLEMFARQRHPGWYVWGREIESDIVVDDQPVPHYTKNATIWQEERKKAR